MGRSARSCRCTGCSFTQWIQPRNVRLQYVIPNGKAVNSSQQIVWCNTCDCLAWAEPLFDATEINLELQAIDPQISFFHFLDGTEPQADPKLQRREELLARLELLRIRKSKPKCLTCGGPTWYPVSFDEHDVSDFIHSCEGRLYLLPIDENAPRFETHRRPTQLDVEGNPL